MKSIKHCIQEAKNDVLPLMRHWSSRKISDPELLYIIEDNVHYLEQGTFLRNLKEAVMTKLFKKDSYKSQISQEITSTCANEHDFKDRFNLPSELDDFKEVLLQA